MQADDFVLFDDEPSEGRGPLGSSHDVRAPAFHKASFLQHRGQIPDSSPLVEEVPYTNFSAAGQFDPLLMQRAMQGDVPPLRKDSPHTLRGTSPNATPSQPSSGTLGAPLTMLSLQGDDQRAQGALFPNLEENGAHDEFKRNTYMPKVVHNTGRNEPSWPYPPNQAPSKGGLDAENDAPLFFPSSGSAGDQWKSWAGTPPGVANPDMLRAAAQASQAGHAGASGPSEPPRPAQQLTQAGDRLTVSPRDLYIDQEGAVTPNARSDQFPSRPQAPLFPNRNDDETPMIPPFGLSSAMEGGSSTEEEDDEDEKPFPSASYAGSVLGATAPNEQLLEQWSRSMYAPMSQGGGSARPSDDASRPLPRTGPSFSAMSTSSESDEDTPALSSKDGDPLSGRAAQFANNVPGALGSYGYLPGSQESGLSIKSADSESQPGSHMSMSMTESDTPGHMERGRSPSILDRAQAIVPASERAPQPPPPSSSEEEEGRPTPARQPSRPADPEQPRQLRSSSNSRRKSANMDVSEARSSAAPVSPESSDPEHDESDYEQSQLAQPTPRATNKRGRATRNASSGHRASGSFSTHSPPTGYSGVLAGAARSANSNSSPTGSSIRCDYVSPTTGQRCGTIFHRMYDLARHRITLHLREEAQLVKDGVLSVDQCVILGKEVDVKKALAELEWTCRICGASFSRKDAMLRHERLRHHR